MLHHLLGLLVGVALAPVLWIAAAWSADLLPELARGETTAATVASATVLCLMGVVCAYLVASRVSPLVAGASGALLTSLSLWPSAHSPSMETALSWLNEDSFLYPSGAGLAVALPLGTLLLFSAAMPLRWRTARDSDPGGRVVASARRERYQRPLPGEGLPGGYGGDTVPDTDPGLPPAASEDFAGDPDKTTTPFRRGETGAVWTPLDEGEGGRRFGRRR